MEENKEFEEMMSDVKEGAYQIAPGMTTEELSPVFFNSDALLEAPISVYRLEGTKARLYYVFDDNRNPVFYTSVTTMIKFSMPTSPYLIKWIAETGYEESKLYAEERASYGTFMHAEIAELAISKRYNLDSLPNKIKAYAEKEKLPVGFVSHVDEIKKDLLAFAQFLIDHDVVVLAVEPVLTHPDGYAGAIDLYCEMTVEESGFFGVHYKTGVNAGKPKKTKESKRVRAIVDFKSGRKGFYEENEVQLRAYKNMWEHNYPNHNVDRLYNWSPKEWRTKPGYHLKDQTNAKSQRKLQHLVEISKIENESWDKNVVLTTGQIDISKGIERNFSEVTFSDLVKNKKKEKGLDGNPIDPRL